MNDLYYSGWCLENISSAGCQWSSVNIGSGSKPPTQGPGPTLDTQHYFISNMLWNYFNLLQHYYISRLSLFPTELKKIHWSSRLYMYLNFTTLNRSSWEDRGARVLNYRPQTWHTHPLSQPHTPSPHWLDLWSTEKAHDFTLRSSIQTCMWSLGISAKSSENNYRQSRAQLNPLHL